MRTVVLRVVALALLLLLALVAVLAPRTLRRLPDTVVYMIASDGTRFTLTPVGRHVGRGDVGTRVERTVAALAAGPSQAEAGRGLASAVPAATRVLDASLQGTTLTVDLNAVFEQGGGSAMMEGRLNQILYTLTRPSGIDSVVLEIEGRPVRVFAGEGIEVANPWRRPATTELPSW